MNDSSPGEGRSIISSTRFLTSTSNTTTTPTDGCLRRGGRSPQRVSSWANAWKRKTSTYIGARASELREPATGPAGQAHHRRRPGGGLHDRQPLHRKIVRQFPD